MTLSLEQKLAEYQIESARLWEESTDLSLTREERTQRASDAEGVDIEIYILEQALQSRREPQRPLDLDLRIAVYQAEVQDLRFRATRCATQIEALGCMDLALDYEVEILIMQVELSILKGGRQ